MQMTPEQCRMARAALDLTTKDLAELAGVRPATLNSYERGGDAYASTVTKLRTALEGRGVTFVAAGEASLAGGAGVRFSKGD